MEWQKDLKGKFQLGVRRSPVQGRAQDFYGKKLKRKQRKKELQKR
jgi:hypothetical protein